MEQQPEHNQNQMVAENVDVHDHSDITTSAELGMFLANFDTGGGLNRESISQQHTTESVVQNQMVNPAHQNATVTINMTQDNRNVETKSLDNLEELLESLSQPNDNEAPLQVVPIKQTPERPTTVVSQSGVDQQMIQIQLPALSDNNTLISGQNQTQFVIPIDTSTLQMQGGNTVLLPIIPTLMPDGRIEMRVAGNAIPLSSAQTLTTGQLSTQTTLQTQIVESNEQQTTGTSNAGMIQPKTVPTDSLAKGVPLVVNLNLASNSTEDKPSNVYEFEDGQIATNLLNSIRTMHQQQQANRNAQPQPLPPLQKKLYRCRYCDYTNAKRYLLVRHMKSHSEERPHYCQICERRFKTQSSLANHINTHTGLRPFRCNQCDASFTTSGEMVRHQRYKHTMERPHKCPDCDYATVELSKLKRHIRSHTGEKPFKCQFCEYSSSDTYKMKRHVRVHTGEKPYECEVCLARFTQSNSLKAHRLTHNPEERPIFQCNFCPTTCSRKTDLRLHVEKQHTSVKPIPCKKCGRSFTDRYSFKLHWKTHEGAKCYNCPHCDYSAFTQRHLDQHLMIHSDVKPFECPEPNCGRQFRQLSQLKRHHNMRHDPYYQVRCGEKKFTCDECGRLFRHMGNMKRHKDWHKQEGQDVPENDPSEQTMDNQSQQQSSINLPSSPQKPGTSVQRNNVKVFNFSKTAGAPQRKKRNSKPRGRRRNPKPEELGLTNIRKRGRPRKEQEEEVDDEEDSFIVVDNLIDGQSTEQTEQHEEDLRDSFGFSRLKQTETHVSSEQQQTVETVDDSMIGADVVPHDDSGFPMIGTQYQSSDSQQMPKGRSVTIFDFEPEDNQ